MMGILCCILSLKRALFIHYLKVVTAHYYFRPLQTQILIQDNHIEWYFAVPLTVAQKREFWQILIFKPFYNELNLPLLCNG